MSKNLKIPCSDFIYYSVLAILLLRLYKLPPVSGTLWKTGLSKPKGFMYMFYCEKKKKKKKKKKNVTDVGLPGNTNWFLRPGRPLLI